MELRYFCSFTVFFHVCLAIHSWSSPAISCPSSISSCYLSVRHCISGPGLFLSRIQVTIISVCVICCTALAVQAESATQPPIKRHSVLTRPLTVICFMEQGGFGLGPSVTLNLPKAECDILSTFVPQDIHDILWSQYMPSLVPVSTNIWSSGFTWSVTPSSQRTKRE
jgi:hypothetical protein